MGTTIVRAAADTALTIGIVVTSLAAFRQARLSAALMYAAALSVLGALADRYTFSPAPGPEESISAWVGLTVVAVAVVGSALFGRWRDQRRHR